MEVFRNIAIIFLSIFFEALPFLLLGAILSSIIERYVSNETIEKLIPKNVFFGSIVGVLLGFFLPACDCAVVPVAKRLIKKGVPINVAVSFMLASPIINPVVLLSTYYAFYNINSRIFWFRLLFGVLISFVIGIVMGVIYKENVIRFCEDDGCAEHDECCSGNKSSVKRSIKKDIFFIIKHACYDFFGVLKFLMLGAILASLVQVLLPRSIIDVFSQNVVLSIIVLMVFAYLLSLCSTSDSFVGKSLLSTFGGSATLAFLLLGPMIDIKNTVVLLGNYKRSFVVSLIALIFVFIFLFCVLGVRIL